MKKSFKLRTLLKVETVVATSGTVDEAAKRLGVHRSSLHRWIASGKVASRIGEQMRVARWIVNEDRIDALARKWDIGGPKDPRWVLTETRSSTPSHPRKETRSVRGAR